MKVVGSSSFISLSYTKDAEYRGTATGTITTIGDSIDVSTYTSIGLFPSTGYPGHQNYIDVEFS